MSQRTAASNNELPGFCGRRGVLETWTEGDGGRHDQEGRRYVGQRFMALSAEVATIRHAQIVLVRCMFPDGKRLYAYLWDVSWLQDERGVA